MNKTYLIFKHEFTHTVKKVGYIIMTLIVPVLALLGIGIYNLATSTSDAPQPQTINIGYVDEVGAFNQQATQGIVQFLPFDSATEAEKALRDKKISQYIVIPVDYMYSGTIQRYTLAKELTTHPYTAGMIKRFLTGNLLKGKVSPEIVSLVMNPLDLKVTRVTEEGNIAQKKFNLGNLVIPGLFSFLMSLALMFGATVLINSLGEEKESRLVEVLFSSVSIRQLLIAKILALGSAGLLQVLVWLLSAPLILKLASSTFGGALSSIRIPGNFLLLGIVYFILGYLLFAILSVTIGGISSGVKEASQLSLFYILTGFAPLWLASLLIAFPHSGIWTVLSIFPVTAPVQTMLRLGISEVPLWELIASISVLALSVVVGLFLSIRIFRIYMLMYGKRPSLKEIFRNLKNQ